MVSTDLPTEIEDPVNIFTWQENLCKSRSVNEDEINLLTQHPVNSFCNSANESENRLFFLQTCPTKFLTYHCLQAINLSSQKQFSSANDLIRLQEGLLYLYKLDLEEFYDINGFYYLLDSTLHQIREMQRKVEAKETDEQSVNKTEQDLSLDWSKLSTSGQSIILAAKLYFFLLVGEPLKDISKLSSQILKLTNSIPEWHYLFCKVESKKRFEGNIPVVKPRKAELTSLKKALELQPSNIIIWTLMIEILFDYIRTDDRYPIFQLLGVNFNSVDGMILFIHNEIKELMDTKNIPKCFWLDINIIASRFYGYRNLPEMNIQKNNKMIPILSKCDAKQLSAEYLNHAVNIAPDSGDVALVEAFRHLKRFDREKALMSLNRALKVQPLNYGLIVVYLRILVGGNKEQRNEATTEINKVLIIAQRHKWPLLAQVHLYFLRGCLFWIDGLLNECIRDWMEGLHLHDTHFLNQFSYWSKTQVRKYMWPDIFTNVRAIELLRNILGNLADLKEEKDEQISKAAEAFLSEIENLFPLNSTISRELKKLCRRWYYLLEEQYASSSDTDTEDTEEEKDKQIPEMSIQTSNIVEIVQNIEVELSTESPNDEEEEMEEPEVVDLISDNEEEAEPQNQSVIMDVQISSDENHINDEPISCSDEGCDDPNEIQMISIDDGRWQPEELKC